MSIVSPAEMIKRIADASPNLKARTAGALSLFGLLAAVFGEFVVPRFELAGDLIALSGMLALTVLLYYVFRPVSTGLSLLAASFNFAGLTCGAIRWNPRGVDTPVVFHGFYCFLIGFLVFRSAFLPPILGALMAFAGLGWLTYLSPQFALYLSPYNLAAGILGEESLMLWLLVKGINAERWMVLVSRGIKAADQIKASPKM